MTRILTGSLHVDPIAANIVSTWRAGSSIRRRGVAGISPRGRRGGNRTDGPPLTAASPATDLAAVDCAPHTVQAWTAYEQRVDARYDAAPRRRDRSSRSMRTA